jgi:hypothetical protein
MSSSTRKDVNYFSIGEFYVYYAGTDNPVYVDSIPNPPVFTPEKPEEFSDIFKVSQNKAPVLVENAVISQGHEDAIDINNRCNDVTLLNATIGVTGKGDQAITIKGGSRKIRISGVLHSRSKSKVDVDIGNWSDQSYNLSEDIELNLTHIDGKPVNVRIGRAKNIKLSGSCKKMVIASILLKAYWWLKWAVRKVLKIPVGQKGPSWL